MNTDLWLNEDNNSFKVEFKANRFLKGMIRIIMHRLLEVGEGKMSLESFENYMITKESPSAVQSAYPQGLYLVKVEYPYLDIPTKKFIV